MSDAIFESVFDFLGRLGIVVGLLSDHPCHLVVNFCGQEHKSAENQSLANQYEETKLECHFLALFGIFPGINCHSMAIRYLNTL